MGEAAHAGTRGEYRLDFEGNFEWKLLATAEHLTSARIKHGMKYKKR
jgi:hypothetical protein